MYIDHQLFSKLTHASMEPPMLGMAVFGQTAIKNTEKLFNLNLTSMRTNWERSLNSTRELMACTDPQQRFSLMAKHTREEMEASLSYGRELTGIALAVQNEFLSHIEAKGADTQSRVNTAIEQWAAEAPASAQAGALLMKAALQHFNKGYEQWKGAIQQSRNAVAAQAQAGAKVADKVTGSQLAAKA